MKKAIKLSLILIIYLTLSIFSQKAFAAEFNFKETGGSEVSYKIITDQTSATVTITSNMRLDQRFDVSIWKTQNRDNQSNQVFSKEIYFNTPPPRTTSFTVRGLEKNKDYFFFKGKVGRNSEWWRFSTATSWYGLSFDKKNSSGGYDMAFFGDPKDQREMFLALSKSSDSTTVLTEISNQSPSTILFPLGKLATKTGDGFATISLPPEKQGRYYAHLIAKNTSGSYEVITQYRNTIVFGNSIGEIFYNKLGKSDFEKTGTNQYKLKGSIDATKHKELDIVPLSTITISGVFYDLKYKQTVLTLPNITPNKDGSYEFDIKTNGIFNDNTNYGLRLTFSSSTGASAIYEVKGVNTSKGYIIPETGKEAEDFLNKNSYRLLAPIPGMTMLLDPELCKLEQQKDPGQICDINAFLNFLLQLAIGAAAVVLVVRIIISGYGYMLTDVPYIKVKLKGQFIEAMIGLVVALSSYLILNTVNPKLVSNNIKIGVASFEVEEILAISSAGYDSNSVKNLSLEEIKKIKTQYGKNWEGSIKGIYIPARDLAVPNISNGIKTLMTAQASYEGFIIPGENSQYPNGSKSFRSNNPGNLGTDWTRTGTFPTLDAGIKAQYNYINRVIKGEHKAYPLGKRLTQPATTLAGHPYPAIDFNPYTGTLRQYLNIYDAGTRLNNSYLTFIISFFQKSGYTITPETTLSQIAQLN
jgi:hypothetical protein